MLGVSRLHSCCTAASQLPHSCRAATKPMAGSTVNAGPRARRLGGCHTIRGRQGPPRPRATHVQSVVQSSLAEEPGGLRPKTILRRAGGASATRRGEGWVRQPASSRKAQWRAAWCCALHATREVAQRSWLRGQGRHSAALCARGGVPTGSRSAKTARAGGADSGGTGQAMAGRVAAVCTCRAAATQR